MQLLGKEVDERLPWVRRGPLELTVLKSGERWWWGLELAPGGTTIDSGDGFRTQEGAADAANAAAKKWLRETGELLRWATADEAKGE